MILFLACQCNGHSTCDEKFRCKTCEDFTEGENCETCVHGYYGKAINGGHCSVCECNGQADVCHTGKSITLLLNNLFHS